MKKAFALVMSLLAAFTFAAFDESHFNYGRQWKGELKGVNLSGKGLSHLAIWLGDNATYNTYWEGDMVRACSQYDLTPVIYAYVIAEYDKDQGYKDCDMGTPNHCTNGAQTIRDHWSDILARYKSYAQGIAQDYGTSKTTIWLIEPDFFQYSASGDARSPYTQQGGGIPDAELCGTRFNQIVAAIKQYLPNAKIAVDISPWLNGDIVGWYANFDQSKVDYLFSSGGRTQGDQSRIRSDNNNLLTWAQASAAMGGKKIIADDGYGVGGGSNNDYQDWMNVNNLNNRISDGVIGITIQDPDDSYYTFAAQHPISLGGGGGNSSSSTAQSSSSRPSSSSANISPTTDKTLLVDDFEDGDYVSLWGGEWGTYNDSENGGASTIQMSVSSGNNSAKAIKVDYSLNSAGAFDYNPFVGLVVDFNEDGSTENLNACTSIQYDYKGPAHRFRVQSDLNVGDNYHGLAVSASSNSWKTQTVNWNSLAQETGWGTVQSIADVRTRANAFSWQIQLASGSTGSLLIDNVKCLGLPEAASSSSSAKSSSSVSSSSARSSSSVSSSSVSSSSASSSSVSSSSVSSSSVSSSSVVSSSGSMGGPCVTFVNGTGDYGDHCYNSGLKNMAEGKCYTMNPERTPVPQYVNDDVSQIYWWVETSCGIVESSSSSEESSSSAIPTFAITFKNGNVTLQTVEVEQGSIPEYTGAEPTKTATAQYTYTFSGWEPALAAVTENATYQAVFNEVTNYYSIRFLNDGAVLATQSVAYGEIPVYSGETPVKEADAGYTYAFDGWTPDLVTVSQDADYTAKFKGTKKKFMVTFVDDDLTTVLKAAEEYDFGTLAANIVQPVTPTKAANAEYTYQFSGWSPKLVDVVDNITYVATYTETKRKYPVTFVDEDGSVLLPASQYDYGTRPANIVTPTDPTKPATAEFTYTFEGWTPAIAMVTGNATYTATYTSTKNKYTVTFVNGDGTTTTQEVEYGETPVAPADKTPANDAQYTYTFAGWTPKIVAVTGNATYTAVVNHTVNKYSVTFKDEDGSVLLAAAEYDYGTAPAGIAKPDDPVKQGTAGETFAFAGWTPTLTAVTEDVVYTATYSSSTNSYTVTFVKDDGTVIHTATYPYGTAAASIVQPRIPEKPATEEYTYEFSGWDPKIADVTGNATYTATYKSFKRKYTITYLNEDGSVFTKAEYEYGTPAKSLYLPENPSKKATDQYTYTFAGWDPALAKVTGDVSYTATFNATVNKYSVTFKDEDGTVLLATAQYDYGTTPANIAKPADPVKQGTAGETFAFAGWTPALAAVTEDVVYTATYTSSTNSYTVTFVNDDGSVILTATYPYGTAAAGIAQPQIPEKPATAEYTYEFSGWSPKIENVTGNATYTATYKEFKRKYTITYLNEDGSVFTKAEYEYGTPAKSLYLAENPTKKATAQYTYTFADWNPTLAMVTGEATYRAAFNVVVNRYTITFLNYDNTQLQSSDVEYGLVPEYGGQTPTKPADAEYTYAFSGWNLKIVAVTGAANYVATYSATAIPVESSSSEQTEESSSSEEQVLSSSAEESSSSEEESSSSAEESSSSEEESSSSAEESSSSEEESSSSAEESSSSEEESSSSAEESSSSEEESSSSAEESSSSEEESSNSAEDSSSSEENSSNSEEQSSSSSYDGPCIAFVNGVGGYATHCYNSGLTNMSEGVCYTMSRQRNESLQWVVNSAKDDSWWVEASCDSGEPMGITGKSSVDVNSSLKFAINRNVLTIAVPRQSLVRVQVFDMLGNRVKTFQDSFAGTREVSLQGLPQGSYMVRVVTGSSAKTSRINIR